MSIISRRLARYCALAAFFLLPLFVQAQSSPVGLWDGTIATPAGDVAFQVEIKSDAAGLHGALLNAGDRQAFTSSKWAEGTLTLRLEYYDGTLSAHLVSPERMQGQYARMTRNGVVALQVTLLRHVDSSPQTRWTGPDLSGDWILKEAGTTGRDSISPLELAQHQNSKVTGILEPVSGDSGLLHGELTAMGSTTHLHLSRFDGIHAMAIDADLQPNGALQGKIAYSPFSAVQFTAQRAASKEETNPNQQAGGFTRVRDPKEIFRFQGQDAEGRVLNQDSPEFKGKPLIIDIFGTWCPNCHDEAPALESLYRKYRDQGLVIVGLAYEYNNDVARSLRQIAVYREKYGITFPLLLAGSTAEGQIEKTLPQLVDFGAYPTTVFIGRDGRVQSIHAGFEGPYTGDKFAEAKDMLEHNTRAIVSGAP